MNRSETNQLAELSLAIRESTLKRLRLVPEGRENWRPSPEAMSFADIAVHLIDADTWLFRKLADNSLRSTQGRAGMIEIGDRNEFDEIIAKLRRTGDERAAVLDRLSDAQLAQRMHDDRFGGEVSAWWIIVRGNLDHEAHHRGQIAAYLQMLAAAG